MTLKEAYNYGVYFLSCNGVEEAEFKSLCLVCYLDGIETGQFQQHLQDDVVMKKFADLLWRVKCAEPLQYVIGKWDFYESEFYVGKGVLIPRPETEELVEKAVEYIKSLSKPVVFDLCSGSGCIGISIAKACPDSFVYLVEKSPDAISYLIKNVEGISNTKIICADITEHSDLPCSDVIVSNPPYIKSDDIPQLQKEVLAEPYMALDGGKDGLDFYRVINDNWSEKLKTGGRLFLEIGENQGEEIKTILSQFKDIEIIKDIYNNDRIAVALKKD